MAIVITFRLPRETCAALVPGYGSPAVGNTEIKSAIKSFLERAIDASATPAARDIPPTVQTERINISLKDEVARKLRAIGSARGLSDSIACQQLIFGMAESAQGQPVEEALPHGCDLMEEIWNATGKQRRIPQAQTYLNIKNALSDGQIALVEASTGIGKTLAMLAAAEERLRSIPDTRVVIAAPTIAVLAQFANAYKELVKSGFSCHPITSVFGKREFVSLELLTELINNPRYIDHKAPILSWVNLGGEPLPDAPFDTPWLTSTLRQVAPGFPVEACTLPDIPSPTDPGYLAYLNQFEHEERDGQEILLCTHAMLSISTKMRHWATRRSETFRKAHQAEVDIMLSIKAADDKEKKESLKGELLDAQKITDEIGARESEQSGKLPPFRYLLVDEAHLLESAMSAANSDYLSVFSLMQKITACHERGVGVTATRLAAAKRAVEKLKSCASFSKDDSLLIGEENRAAILAKEALVELLDAITFSKGRKKDLTPADEHALRQMVYARALLKSATAGHSGNRASVRFSPVREFPQIFVGAGRVDNLMRTLWGAVKAAACVSATLFVPKKDEGYSSSYMRSLLAVPEGRQKDFPPVVPHWLYNSVVEFHLPSKKMPLCPVSRSAKLSGDARIKAEADWLQRLAHQVGVIHESAVGGSLVLMTSYDSVKKIAAMLPPAVSQYAVFASTDASLAEQCIAFLKLATGGHRPVWFAVGSAWTGLDIGGHEPLKNILSIAPIPAAEDNILTDLLIPRLPFGINKSVTHEYRIKTTPQVPWEVLDMTFRLKQGIGRIVRREGLPPNRRIFLLDGRIYQPGFEYISEQVGRLIKPYPNKVIR